MTDMRKRLDALVALVQQASAQHPHWQTPTSAQAVVVRRSGALPALQATRAWPLRLAGRHGDVDVSAVTDATGGVSTGGGPSGRLRRRRWGRNGGFAQLLLTYQSVVAMETGCRKRLLPLLI